MLANTKRTTIKKGAHKAVFEQKKLYQIRKVELTSRPCFPIMKGLDRTAYKVYNSRYL